MIIKRFSATKILNTNSAGFIRGRKYDTDLDRLGRGEVKRELADLRKINYNREMKDSIQKTRKELAKAENMDTELKKIKRELNNGRGGKWLNID